MVHTTKDAQYVLEGLHTLVKKQLEMWNVPGLALAIVKDGEIIMAEGFGYRDVERKLPVTPNTMFAIGSCTKAFTAMVAAQLVDDEKLEWDTPVRTYLPDFDMYDSMAAERITLRDMLCHRTGLPRHDNMWYGSILTREEIIKRIKYLEPNVDFRSTWQYNNIMYTAAGYLAGHVAECNWEQLVQERIFNPLEMKESGFSVNELKLHDNAGVPYIEQEGQLREVEYRNFDAIGPAGSINSTVMDMSNWLIAHLEKGTFKGKQIISERNLAILHSPQMSCPPMINGRREFPLSSYGLGWGFESYRGYRMLQHGGGIDGFTSHISFLPDERIGIVLLTNRQGTMLPTSLALTVYDRLLNLDPIEWCEQLREDIHKWEAQRKQMAAENAASRGEAVLVSSTTLQRYEGHYDHPGYGIVKVQVVENGLQADFHLGCFRMSQTGEHVFTIHSEMLGVTANIKFVADEEGNVIQLSAPLNIEPGAKDITFRRTKNSSIT
ncbi:serine hydrolase [Paenibacillaceae sp. P-4]|uniref:serine hydrolase n=1 Tax=Paenibacillaceae bacterium P-4 TaxID=3160969 RepID=UPI0032E811F1